MRTECFLFVSPHHKHFGKAQHVEHSGDINCSLLVNSSHSDESSEGQKTLLWIYALSFFIEPSIEDWWEENIFCSFTTPQTFWQSSAPGTLSTLVASVFLYSLTRATLMSPGNDEIYIYIYAVCIYKRYIYNKRYIYI